VQAQAAVSFFTTEHAKGKVLTYSAGSNTGATTGLVYEYMPVVVGGQLVISDKTSPNVLKPFFEFVNNTNGQPNVGGIIGACFGRQSIKNFGDWQTKVSYRYLERDAWLDILPQSDAYHGATSVQGLAFTFDLGISEREFMVVNVYSMDTLNTIKNRETLLEIEYNAAF
jgi:hypothetical protein